MQTPDKHVVIVASGTGTRMGASVPKQFLKLQNRPIINQTILRFREALEGVNIILALPEDQISYYAELCKQFRFDTEGLTIVAGGETRFHSVKNGISAIEGEGLVAVHDAVRPLLSNELIHRTFEEAAQQDSAIPTIPVTSSLREVEGKNSKAIDRNNLCIVQTPQCFPVKKLQEAFQQDYQPSFTDEATVMEAFGENIHLMEGEATNIKITTPEDLRMAEALMEESD